MHFIYLYLLLCNFLNAFSKHAFSLCLTLFSVKTSEDLTTSIPLLFIFESFLLFTCTLKHYFLVQWLSFCAFFAPFSKAFSLLHQNAVLFYFLVVFLFNLDLFFFIIILKILSLIFMQLLLFLDSILLVCALLSIANYAFEIRLF